MLACNPLLFMKDRYAQHLRSCSNYTRSQVHSNQAKRALTCFLALLSFVLKLRGTGIHLDLLLLYKDIRQVFNMQVSKTYGSFHAI
jgi:hypothetical protein